MPTYTNEGTSKLKFPVRTNTRLQVSLVSNRATSTNVFPPSSTDNSLEDDLREVQSEIVDAEIFSALVKEASTLPTSSARVSERLVAVEVTDNVELRFELVILLFFWSCSRY